MFQNSDGHTSNYLVMALAAEVVWNIGIGILEYLWVK